MHGHHARVITCFEIGQHQMLRILSPPAELVEGKRRERHENTLQTWSTTAARNGAERIAGVRSGEMKRASEKLARRSEARRPGRGCYYNNHCSFPPMAGLMGRAE